MSANAAALMSGPRGGQFAKGGGRVDAGPHEAKTPKEAKEHAELTKEGARLSGIVRESVVAMKAAKGYVAPKGEALAVAKSVTLWTGGDIATVRDPKLYDAELSKRSAGGDGFSTRVDRPSKADYEKAHAHVKALAAAPYTGPAIHRGMSLPADAIKLMKPGMVMPTGTIASFTKDPAVAERFSRPDAERREGKAETKGGVKHGQVMITISKPTRGTDITVLSHYIVEREVVSSGNLRITGVRRDNKTGITHWEAEHAD